VENSLASSRDVIMDYPLAIQMLALQEKRAQRAAIGAGD
jgi:hypothetical protein